MFEQILAEVFSSPTGIFNEGGKSAGYYVITVAAFLACFAVILFAGGQKDIRNKTKEIAYAGICVALSTVLSLFKLFSLPQGGSVTPASVLPLAIYSYMYGFRKGTLVCFAYGMLQALMGGYIVHPVQFLLDYPVAFSTIGMAGLFRKTDIKIGFLSGFILSLIVRYAVHGFGGMIFFAEYASSQTAAAVFAYSFGYNSFVFVDGAIAAVLGVALIINKGFARQMRSAVPYSDTGSADADTDNQK